MQLCDHIFVMMFEKGGEEEEIKKMTSCKESCREKWNCHCLSDFFSLLTFNILDSWFNFDKDSCLIDNFDDPIEICLLKKKISFNYELFKDIK